MRPGILGDKAGLAGLALLALLVAAGIAGPWLVPFPGAAEHWRDIEYWQDNPAAAPPAWTRLLPGAKPAAVSRTLRASPADASQALDGRVRWSWDFPLPAEGEPAPSSAILRMRGAGTALLRLSIQTGGQPPGQAEWREIHRELVDLSDDKDTRIPLPANVLLDFSSIISLRVETVYLIGPGVVPAPELLLVGQLGGLLGTDAAKRDIFTGVVLGIRWALVLGVLASLLTVLSGMAFGIIAGCLRGIPDLLISRLYEYFYLIPVLPLLIVLSTVFKPSIWTFLLLVILLFWTRAFKPIYAMALQIRSEGYIEAAKALGASRLHIWLRHVLPTLLPYGFTVMALSVPGIIVYEASVSLLGLGDSSTVTWGQMLHDALNQGAVINQLWWWVLPPGLAIALTGLSFALMGRSLDRILHPKAYRR